MEYNIGDRHKAYEKAYEYEITRRLPIIIRVDGVQFHRVTKKLIRPYCPAMQDLMAKTMLATAKDIEGAVFAYQQSDEISYVLRNDQSLESEPWFGNRIQKIASVTASKTTANFHKLFYELGDKAPDLVGAIGFDGRVFCVPNLSEVVNNLLFRQQDCTRNALTNAARSELGAKLGLKTADKILKGKNGKDRLVLLQKECEIDFNEFYPTSYRHGIGAYKIPKVIVTDDKEQIIRQRWALDLNLPKFNENREFILSILNSGRDIFRAGRDLEEEEGASE